MPLSELAAQTDQTVLPTLSPKALLKLPFLATVETIVSTRGFGFLKIEGSSDQIFFHVTAALSNDQDLFLTLKEGDRVLCQIGSTLREPSKPAAVLWTPVTGRDWAKTGTPDSQAALDQIRRVLFEKTGIQEIGRILEAGWYRRKWRESPPADLQDPVLQQVFTKALSALSPGDFSSGFNAGKNYPFAFVAFLDPLSDAADLSAILTSFTPTQLASICEPRADWSQAMGPQGQAWRLSEDQKVVLLNWAAQHSSGEPERFRAT